MRSKPFFPSLPRKVSTLDLRKEIRRRMEIMERLGLSRKPKKWPAGQRLVQAFPVRNHHYKERHAAVFMAGCHCLEKIIQITSTVIAPKRLGGWPQKAMPILSTWRQCLFSLELLRWRGNRRIRFWDGFVFISSKLFASPWTPFIYPLIFLDSRG